MSVLPMHHGRTLVMGVLNVTPDSFSDGGNFFSTDAALTQARRLIAEGADILDIGAESTRPGSDPVSEQEELDRVAPVIEKVAKEFATPISIDTCKPVVADQCCQRGATIVNDVTGLTDVNMLRAVKQHRAAVVIMHMRGKPKTMQQNVDYVDVVVEVREFLAERVAAAKLERARERAEQRAAAKEVKKAREELERELAKRRVLERSEERKQAEEERYYQAQALKATLQSKTEVRGERLAEDRATVLHRKAMGQEERERSLAAKAEAERGTSSASFQRSRNLCRDRSPLPTCA